MSKNSNTDDTEDSNDEKQQLKDSADAFRKKYEELMRLAKKREEQTRI
jgi:hypothetical protein